MAMQLRITLVVVFALAVIRIAEPLSTAPFVIGVMPRAVVAMVVMTAAPALVIVTVSGPLVVAALISTIVKARGAVMVRVPAVKSPTTTISKELEMPAVVAILDSVAVGVEGSAI